MTLGHARRHCNALITLDRGIPHQHDHRGHRLIILVLRVKNNTIEEVLTRLEDITGFLASAGPGAIAEV